MSPAGSTPVFVVTILNWAREIYDFAFYPGESPGTWKHMQGIGPTDREGMRKFSLASEVLKWFGTGCTLLQQLPGSDQKTGTWSKELSFSFVCYWFGLRFFGVRVVVYDPMEGVWSMPVTGHHLLNRRVKPWLRRFSVLLSISSYFGWRRKDQVSWQRDYGRKAVVIPCLWRDLFDKRRIASDEFALVWSIFSSRPSHVRRRIKFEKIQK